MAKIESLGIKRMESMHYYVHNLERSQKYYVDKLDFALIGQSTPKLEEEGKQRSKAFAAGNCVVVCSEPVGKGGRAWRYLQKHPDGVGTLVFEVEDAERTFKLLDKRGGTFINDIQTAQDDGGTLKYFSITTPLTDATIRFVERKGYKTLYPGIENLPGNLKTSNKFGFRDFDHITCNFQTMKPGLLWMEHVLGFEKFWDVEFHTDDVSHKEEHGSGLKSIVMYDPNSPVKFANNEPYRPFFKSSQINIFNEEYRGDGIQHVAITVGDIIPAVRGMRERGIEFMPTPCTYYDMLPAHLTRLNVGSIDEDINTLRELEILVDGGQKHSYMLQIFLKESAGTHKDTSAGPFFYEIIQRKGDQGFGAGNFRALFESIERAQKQQAKAPVSATA